MNRLCAALLALPLLAAPAAAQCGKSGCLRFGFGTDITLKGFYSTSCGPAPPCCPGGGGGGYGGGYGGGDGAGLGPWYLYWPQEAHFQTPAPTGYPYWPAPQTLQNGNGNGAALPANGGYPLQPAAYAPGTPAYWYGR
jgi:hypothetical protein